MVVLIAALKRYAAAPVFLSVFLTVTCLSSCSGQFTDIGASLSGLTSSSLAWGDYDNDGDMDLAVSGYTGMTRLLIVYRNTGGVFSNSGMSMTGIYYSALAWGDYDGDGDLDLAAAGATANSQFGAIYRNDGGALVYSGISLPAVKYCSLAWGDYDNDGDLDLAIAGSAPTETVTKIYRNDGSTFIDSGIDIEPVSNCCLAWGDYDNDGDLDLAIAGNGSASGLLCRIYRNDGGTAFTDIGAGFTGFFHGSVAWGDYDNDGDLDLAMAGMVSPTERLGKIYRNDGGSFVDIGAGVEGVSYSSLTWGDYDNDGDLDLAVAGSAVSSACTARIYRNDSGTFVDSGVSLVGIRDGGFAWGDYDGDGDLDLALVGQTASGAGIAKIYRNDAATANTPPVAPGGLSATVDGASITFSWNAASDSRTPAAGLSYNLRVGTAPGSADVFSGMASPTTGLRQLSELGNAQKRRTWKLSGLPLQTYYWSVQAIDTSYAGSQWAAEQTVSMVGAKVSGFVRMKDGAPVAGVTLTGTGGGGTAITDSAGYYELAVPSGWSGNVTPAKATYWFAPASRTHANVSGQLTGQDYTAGTFIDSGVSLQGIGSGSLAWGDYDNDGDLDLAAAGTTGSARTAKVYRNDGGAFTDVGAPLVGVDICSLAWGDYDGDGDLDLVIAGRDNSGGSARIYRNDGGSFVDISAGLTGVYNCSVAWGDYDNDGDLDLAIAGQPNTGNPITRVYRNDHGTFTDSGVVLSGVTYAALAWGDYDNDGDLDLAVAGQSTLPYRSTKIYRNDGGTFSDSQIPLPVSAYGSLAWGDFDSDGDLDLAFCGQDGAGTPTTWVYRNDGGTFTKMETSLVGLDYGCLAWGDYDDDGDLDLAVTGYTLDTAQFQVSRIYRNDAGTFTDSGAAITQASRSTLAWGDYDNDGDLDLAVAGNSPTGTMVLRICRNDSAAANTPPTAPAFVTTYSAGGSVTFSWAAAADSTTPASGLSYNLRVGTSPGADDIFSGQANSSTGLRRLPGIGNAQKRRSWTLDGLSSGPYYWSVQAVDSAFAGSPWTAEKVSVSSRDSIKARTIGRSQVIWNRAVVTAVFPSYFYVESRDRSVGIRVRSSLSVSVSMLVNIDGGIMTDSNGERCILADWAQQSGAGETAPVGMINRNVGGGDWTYLDPTDRTAIGQRGVIDGVGLNNIGLLIRTSGTVVEASPPYYPPWFTIDDGRGRQLEVIAPSGVSVPAHGQLVGVTGISSCTLRGNDLYRRILVRNQSDITVY